MVPSSISFPREQDSSRTRELQSSFKNENNSDDSNDMSDDEDSDMLIMVVPLKTTCNHTRRRSSCLIESWKFNIDWEDGLDSSFKSVGTEGASSLYQFLECKQGGDECHVVSDDAKFPQGESFKRGSLLESIISDEMCTSFRAIYSEMSDDKVVVGTHVEESSQGRVGKASSPASNEILDVDTSLGRLINMDSDLGYLMTTHNLNSKEVSILQERVKNLQEIDDELKLARREARAAKDNVY